MKLFFSLGVPLTLLLTSCNGILGVPVVPVVQNDPATSEHSPLHVQHHTPPKKKTASPKLIAGKYTVKSTQRGKMSWYSVKTNGGTTTASGERFSNTAQTAAHRKLSFGTRVRVTNLRNGKSEIVRITDRGPFIKGRIIDVSIGVARKLGFVNAGVVPCKVEVLGKP